MSTYLTTHRHPNSTEWMLARSGEVGKRSWNWTCVNPDKTITVYPCTKTGWISMESPPLIFGTLAIVYDTDQKEQFADEWYQCPEYKNTQWLYTDNALCWMPQAELPEVGL